MSIETTHIKPITKTTGLINLRGEVATHYWLSKETGGMEGFLLIADTPAGLTLDAWDSFIVGDAPEYIMDELNLAGVDVAWMQERVA